MDDTAELIVAEVASFGRRGMTTGDIASRLGLPPGQAWREVEGLLATGRLYWRNPRRPRRLLMAPRPCENDPDATLF